MTPGFDIFQTEPEGTVLWRGAAATLEEAKARVQQLAVSSPGEYFALNFSTGSKIPIPSDGADEAEKKSVTRADAGGRQSVSPTACQTGD